MIDPKSVKIVFWGTSDFAIPSLRSLIDSGYSVLAVITNPDKPAGRKKILTPPPVKVLAQKYNIPVLQPVSLSDYGLPPITYNLFIVAAYGKIIPKEILNLPRYGALNIHPSLLPRWRGSSPIQYTILKGDTETGVTIMIIDERIDHGPIIATSDKQRVTREATNQELHDKLAEIGAKLLLKILPKYLAGEIKPIPQDESKATYSKILTKEDGKIDWSKSAEEIERMVRAFDPWPGAWTTWPSAKKIYRIKIDEAEVAVGGVNGQPCLVGPDMTVKTGRDSLKINKLTLEGKKTVKVEDFIRGNPDILGAILN